MAESEFTGLPVEEEDAGLPVEEEESAEDMPSFRI